MSTKAKKKKPSYIQLKVNISETTPTGIVVLDALLSEDPEFLKRYGLGPKVNRANKLLWLAYLGVTQGHNPNNENIIQEFHEETPTITKEETAIIEEVKEEPSTITPTLSELSDDFDLPMAELKITKADEVDDEDALDENALMGGLI
jgi:hypothetical protein